MYTQLFTVEAALVYSGIPKAIRYELAGQTWCKKCETFAPIGNLSGSMKKGDLLLRGNCGFCFKAVRKVVKASEFNITFS